MWQHTKAAKPLENSEKFLFTAEWWCDPIGALAGDKTKARSAYQDFLTHWKDADPDIPILKKAQAEHANLN
jgi:hypothetical protein